MTDLIRRPACIKIQREHAATILQLDRVEKHNALNMQMILELTEAVEAAGSDEETRAVVIIGSGQAFSTGVDLQEALEIQEESTYVSASARWRALTNAIEHCSKPVIACISGYCLTGGLEVALACDIRLAEADAVLGITSAKVGSVAGIGATQRLPRLIGPGRAKRMLFTARFVDGVEAAAMGLVDEIVEPGTVRAAGLELVEEIAATAPLSVTAHKRAVNQGLDMSLDSGLDLEAELSKQAFLTEDKREGMSAFLERRKPVFRGC